VQSAITALLQASFTGKQAYIFRTHSMVQVYDLRVIFVIADWAFDWR
jgi:hypothetical protein